jgi:acetyltransferase-like isoleucine patch superfamily enzyme
MPRKSRKSNVWVDPLALVSRVLTKLYSLWIAAVYPFASRGKKLSVHYTCDIRNPQLIEAANDIIIHKDVWLHAWPSDSANDGPTLQIGDACLIGRRSHISARNLIAIEADVIISASVLIQDHGHAYDDVDLPIRLQGIVRGGKIRIGRGAWIGQGAAVVCTEGELVLGANCVVAANAVVTKSAPPFSVLSGNPARVVKQFDSVKGAWVLGSSRPVGLEGAKLEHISSSAALP